MGLGSGACGERRSAPATRRRQRRRSGCRPAALCATANRRRPGPRPRRPIGRGPSGEARWSRRASRTRRGASQVMRRPGSRRSRVRRRSAILTSDRRVRTAPDGGDDPPGKLTSGSAGAVALRSAVPSTRYGSNPSIGPSRSVARSTSRKNSAAPRLRFGAATAAAPRPADPRRRRPGPLPSRSSR